MKPQAEPVRHYYRPYELARALDEPVSNVYRLIKLNLIAHIRIRKKLKIPTAEYERLLREGTGEK
jgi:hypothetical protein